MRRETYSYVSWSSSNSTFCRKINYLWMKSYLPAEVCRVHWPTNCQFYRITIIRASHPLSDTASHSKLHLISLSFTANANYSVLLIVVHFARNCGEDWFTKRIKVGMSSDVETIGRLWTTFLYWMFLYWRNERIFGWLLWFLVETTIGFRFDFLDWRKTRKSEFVDVFVLGKWTLSVSRNWTTVWHHPEDHGAN